MASWLFIRIYRNARSPEYKKITALLFHTTNLLQNTQGYYDDYCIFLPVCMVVLNPNWKWWDISTTQYLYLSNLQQQHQDLWKGASVYDQACPSVHWFKWRTFWIFAVKYDFINNKNSTVIKLGMCNVNVLRQLSVKYYIVMVVTVNVIFRWNSKTSHIQTYIYIWTFFFVLMSLTHSWSLSTYLWYTLQKSAIINDHFNTIYLKIIDIRNSLFC